MMATFTLEAGTQGPSPSQKGQFTFINHSDRSIEFDLQPATGYFQVGEVKPGQTVDSAEFVASSWSIEQGDVPVITIPGAPTPGFRFWSGFDGLEKDQYINVLAGEGYAVTKDNDEISEVTGNGLRITVDGGGKDDPSVKDMYIQVYNA